MEDVSFRELSVCRGFLKTPQLKNPQIQVRLCLLESHESKDQTFRVVLLCSLLTPRWDLTDLGTALGRPYEDMTVVFYDLGKDADYNDMAKLYRRYRLSRDPSIKTLKERTKERPHLLKLARSIPVRQQVAHKPFKRPDDAIDFTPETEHPVKCTCSFAQVRENMKLLHDLEGTEDDKILREIVVHPDGLIAGSWYRNKKIIAE